MQNRIFIGFLLGSLILLFSCKGDKAIEEDKATDTVLDIAMLKEPPMLNPLFVPGSTARSVFHNIFSPMADFHPETYELSPILIDEIPAGELITDGPYKGGTAYTIRIRDEARWDDGSPITAKDVVFTIKAIKHQGTNAEGYRDYMKWVTDITLDSSDERKCTFLFKDYYILAKELAVTVEVYPQYHYDPMGILDKVSIPDLDGPSGADLVKNDNELKAFAEAFNGVRYARDEPVGAGPYRLKEWTAGQLIVLERKEDYWAEGLDIPSLENNPEEIRFHFFADETSVISQLKEGNIDLAANVSANTFFDLKDNETYSDDFQYLTPELMRFYYIDINNTKPELADPDVRRALAKLVDVPKLVEVLEGGLGNPTVGIFNSKKSYYNRDLKEIAYDVSGARDILSEEGWKDTNGDGSIDKVIEGRSVEMDLDIHITGSELSKNIALLLQESAKKVGIKINIITKPWKSIVKEEIKTRSYDLVPRVLSQDLTLDDPFIRWHSSNDDPSKSNDSGYRSEAADELIEKIRSTQNEAERTQYYLQLQEQIYNDQPVIFLYNPQEKIILSKRWKGSATMKRPGYFAGTFIPS